ncbi:MAG: M14 family zinc carboxypeptidase [Pseudomonadota bacterium]
MRLQPPAELIALQALLAQAGDRVAQRVLCEVQAGGTRMPVLAVTLGNPDPAVPAIGFFGGVHGLERIGAEVVLAYLSSLVRRLHWDQLLQRQLQGLRLVFMPLVNPGGLARGTRANPQGVDLMRNAPVECREPNVPFLLGGQRLSAALPWYRGPAGAALQPEAQALCEVVESELLGHAFAIALDCHSGFGLTDRLWFPYAHTPRPVEHLPELQALAALLDETVVHHPYVIEPQSRQYLAHGDLWDHLYLRALERGRTLLPLTLEMGSWLWVKKNPRQFFSRQGLFNPLIGHRQQRVLRRHMPLFDFFTRAAYSHAQWRPAAADRPARHEQALDRWYRGRKR